MVKVLLIGLDGATWNLIRPWAEKGKLPEFKRLMENGVWGDLESTIPPYTIPAWISMVTGKTPKTLGLYTFMVKKGYDFTPYFRGKRREKTFWDILCDEGKRVCILNLPNVYSTYKIKGVMVAGFLCTSRENLTYPPGLIKELDNLVEGYEIDSILVDTKGTPRSRRGEEGQKLNHISRVHEKHFKTFKYIISRYRPDCAFLVFTLLDRVQHSFWGKKGVLLNCYKMIDSELQDLMDSMGEDTITILVSDHGFGPVKRKFYVNEWLLKKGYLVLDTENSNKRSLVKMMDTFASKKTKVKYILRSLFSILPQKIKETFLREASPISYYNLSVNWGKTKAFAYSGLGEIYLNVKGREPHGIIEKRDYERTRNALIKSLKMLRDPNTRKEIPIEVFKVDKSNKRDIYSDTPDLIIKVDDEINRVDTTIGHNRVILNFKEYTAGQHRIEGIFLAKGPNIKNGIKITGVKIHDIAPTILHIFNIPILKEMDGKVLKKIFKADSELAKKEVVYQRFETKKEKIKKKIEKLREQNIGSRNPV